MDYLTVKNELKKINGYTKYFTKQFFNSYIKAIETGKKTDNNGIDDKYIKDGITYRHRYDEIYQSRFYNENSCAYCHFLEIMARA